MQQNTLLFYSQNLQRTVEIPVYGHYGFALVMFPALSDSALIYEENGTIDKIKPFLNKGKCRVFAVPSINEETWFTEKLSNEEKSKQFLAYNNFISDELVPMIYAKCNGPVPIITCGASIGGFLAANSYFRRPDCFYGAISMSGFFNIEYITNYYFDDNCYYNSPVHYLPNLNDSYWLSFLKSKHHVYLYSGSGENEFPHNTENLAKLLKEKEIKHSCEIWGSEYGHNFDTWNEMLFNILNTKL